VPVATPPGPDSLLGSLVQAATERHRKGSVPDRLTGLPLDLLPGVIVVDAAAGHRVGPARDPAERTVADAVDLLAQAIMRPAAGVG
jgi:hypothetical protein